MNPSRATVPLILVTLALSLAAVALIVNGALSTPNIEDVALSCAQATTSSQARTSCPETTKEPVRSIITISPSSSHPGFSYPLGLNAIAEETTSGTTITLTGSGLFFSECLDCTNEVVAVISTAPFVLNGTETLDGFMQAAYADNTSVIIEKEVHGNGTQYTVTGNSLEAPFGPFTHVRFFGATTEAFVLLPESDLLPVGVAERDTFVSSLNFSLIP
jgi:hypothetical protein